MICGLAWLTCNHPRTTQGDPLHFSFHLLDRGKRQRKSTGQQHVLDLERKMNGMKAPKVQYSPDIMRPSQDLVLQVINKIVIQNQAMLQGIRNFIQKVPYHTTMEHHSEKLNKIKWENRSFPCTDGLKQTEIVAMEPGRCYRYLIISMEHGS